MVSSERDFYGKYKFQILSTFAANLLSLCYGAFAGWPSAAFLLFQSADSPFEGGPLTTNEISWIGSILCIGGLLGNLFFGWLSDKLGRKLPMLLAVLPMLISWILIILAKNAVYLIFARFLGGFAGGAIFILVPLYVTEISEDRIRGSLGSCLILFWNLGMLLAFISGNYMSYNTSPYIYIGLIIVFLILFMFLPESPIYLMKSRKEMEAEKSLRYYRNLRKISQPPEGFKTEMEKLKCEYIEEKSGSDDTALSWSDFNNPVARRVIVIGIALMALNQFCGCFAMVNYTATIFEISGSSLSPNMSAIIVGIIQLVGSYVSTLLVERAGRKLLLIVSAFGTGFGHISLGMFCYLKGLGCDVESFKWVPIASFSLVIFAASWGVLTLPFMMLTEITPVKIRSLTVSFCMVTLWIFAFILVKYFPIVAGILELHGCLFIFAACCFSGALFVLIFVPETKGKSLESILAFIEERTKK